MCRLIVLSLLATSVAVLAAEPTPTASPVMVEAGKLLIADDFAAGPSKEWRAGKGKWDAADGAVRGTEVASDMHAATLRRPTSFRDGVVEYRFRFDKARAHTLSLNDPKGHVCRVRINASGFVVQKDAHDKSRDKLEVLGRCDMPIKPGEWYSISIEFRGPEILARIGDKVAYGTSTAIDVDKSNVGLTVGGDGVAFRDFKLWAGTPAKDWEKKKAAVLKK